MNNMPTFRPGVGANDAHFALKNSIEIRDRAQHCAALWFSEIMHRELYRELGFSTMRTYAEEKLGFSATRAGDFLTLAKRLEKLPAVKEELANGKLGYTAAREIISVVDTSNEKDWVKLAKEQPRAKLRAQVKKAKELARQNRKTDPNQGELMPRPVSANPPAAVTIKLTIEMTPLQYAQYEESLRTVGHQGSKAEILLDAVDALAASQQNTRRRVFDSERTCPSPRTQIHIHTCPQCLESAVATPRGEIKLSEEEAETAACDAMIHEPGQPNKSTIPPRVRREVLTRDRHQCRRKGCNHTRHLNLHHIDPRQHGGNNDPENLVTLCTKCHDLWHDKGGHLGTILTPIPMTAE